MKLTIDTDNETNQCYISFGEDVLSEGVVASTLRVTDDLMLDFNSEGRLVGMDVLHASSVLGEDYETLEVDALVGVKEAAALAGVRTSNFVRDYAAKGDFPPPVAELATGRIWLRSRVVDYLEARRRPKPAARTA